MSENRRALLLGATGRTGGRALAQLLERQVGVRAIVRSAERLPAALLRDPRLEVIEAEISTMPVERLAEHMSDVDVVISCLGHTITARGVFGPPRDLVCGAVSRVCEAAAATGRQQPTRVILMTSVSVERPDRRDTRRGGLERAMAGLLRALVPPAADNQSAADALAGSAGAGSCVEWVVIRPDTLLEGDVTEYILHEGLVSSLSRPDKTNMANIAHFICELTTDDATWARWRGTWPVIVNA